jgi:hypothetical protein
VFANDQLVGIVDFPHKWATQSLIVPASALRKGKNRIRFEYDSPVRPAAVNRKLRDERELAVRFSRVQLLPMEATKDLNLGTSGARPFLLEGWSGDERDGERDAIWSNGPRASVVLSLKGITKPILRLSAQGYGRALPIGVKVTLNGKTVGAFAAPDSWQTISVPLPNAAYTDPGELLAFEFDHTRRPTDDNPKSHDQRALALRVDRIWVESEDMGETVDSSVRSWRSKVTGGRTGIAASR